MGTGYTAVQDGKPVRPDLDLRYHPKGVVVHYSRDQNLTVCGQWRPAGFHGTGSQKEYDKAKSMRLCSRCEKKIGAL